MTPSTSVSPKERPRKVATAFMVLTKDGEWLPDIGEGEITAFATRKDAEAFIAAYAQMAERRIHDDAPLFAGGAA